MSPGFCISEVVKGHDGSGCGDADVVLFNEGSLIWNGAYANGDSWTLPAKAHQGQVYIYFAHESPSGFGAELLNKRLMDQLDYLAYSNEAGSALWWNFLPSVRPGFIVTVCS